MIAVSDFCQESYDLVMAGTSTLIFAGHCLTSNSLSLNFLFIRVLYLIKVSKPKLH